MDRADRNKVAETVKISGHRRPESWPITSPAEQLAKLREEIEMARELLPCLSTASPSLKGT